MLEVHLKLHVQLFSAVISHRLFLFGLFLMLSWEMKLATRPGCCLVSSRASSERTVILVGIWSLGWYAIVAKKPLRGESLVIVLSPWITALLQTTKWNFSIFVQIAPFKFFMLRFRLSKWLGGRWTPWGKFVLMLPMSFSTTTASFWDFL